MKWLRTSVIAPRLLANVLGAAVAVSPAAGTPLGAMAPLPHGPMPFANADELPAAGAVALGRARVVWLGEMHGTQEAPALFLGLVRLLSAHHQRLIVGLELPPETQEVINEYLRVGDLSAVAGLDFFQSATYSDGRSSHAMLALLRDLRDANVASVFCFDRPGDDHTTRDAAMGHAFAQAVQDHPDAHFAALSGNLHSRITVGVPWDDQFRSSAFTLASAGVDVFTLNLQYAAGTVWACIDGKPCGERELQGRPIAGVDHFALVLHEQPTRGHHGVLYTREITASPPVAGIGSAGSRITQ